MHIMARMLVRVCAIHDASQKRLCMSDICGIYAPMLVSPVQITQASITVSAQWVCTWCLGCTDRAISMHPSAELEGNVYIDGAEVSE